MRLNHLALTVTDVRATSAFLATYFGLEPIGKANDTMMHLQDDGALILSLFAVGPFSDRISEPAATHIGFIQASEAQVLELHRRLTADGYHAPAPERSHGFTFTFVAPGGIAIEVMSD